MRRGRLPILIVGVTLMAGCAPAGDFPKIDAGLARDEARKQRAVAMKASARREARVRNVAFRIMAGNVELCGDKVQKTTGFLATTLEQYSGRVREWRETAREVLGVGERPTVVHVAEGSPAHLAGLKAGDELLRLNGQALGTGKASGRKVSEIFGNSESEDFTLTIERRGEARELALGRAAACDYPVLIVNRYDVNAWADGERIYVTAGMLRFTENDEELALIIGHELAHNTRGHVASKKGNTLLGVILGAAAAVLSGVDVTSLGAQTGGLAYSQDFEAEADYVGVYHAGRAGYDVRKAASFLRRLGALRPAAIRLAGSAHPSTAKRFLAVERAVAEFERKRKSGLPLLPDERADR